MAWRSGSSAPSRSRSCGAGFSAMPRRFAPRSGPSLRATTSTGCWRRMPIAALRRPGANGSPHSPQYGRPHSSILCPENPGRYMHNGPEKARMFSVELYGRVRHACQIEGLSQREAARRFGLHRNTVRKMLAFSVPPGYRRTKPAARPKLDPFTSIIDGLLEADGSAPPKQRHTAKRIYERLRAEHGYAGGYTTVKDYVREHRARGQEMFVPLMHPPGHAPADFGEAVAVIGGVRQKIHFFCLDLPHSDAGFVKAYPAERIEAFCDGHNAAFAFLGGGPKSILYDNTKLAVARILGDGTRQRTRAFAELQSHYLFLDRFGRPGKGNDKGKVEGLVGYARRNFLVPIPTFASFADLNEQTWPAKPPQRMGPSPR